MHENSSVNGTVWESLEKLGDKEVSRWFLSVSCRVIFQEQTLECESELSAC
jgi:hypothetical protein